MGRKVLTLENLLRLGIIVVDWCFLCKKKGENVEHII